MTELLGQIDHAWIYRIGEEEFHTRVNMVMEKDGDIKDALLAELVCAH